MNPLDPALGLPWPQDVELQLSEKDAVAPSLEQARAAGLLPTMQACRQASRALDDAGGTSRLVVETTR